MINTKTTPQRADHTDIIQYTKNTETVKYKHIMTLMKLHGITLTREWIVPQWRQRWFTRIEGELERLLNRGELFFWFCALRLKTKTGVKSFDSFVVEGQVKDIEEASDRALKGIENHFATGSWEFHSHLDLLHTVWSDTPSLVRDEQDAQRKILELSAPFAHSQSHKQDAQEGLCEG